MEYDGGILCEHKDICSMGIMHDIVSADNFWNMHLFGTGIPVKFWEDIVWFDFVYGFWIK